MTVDGKAALQVIEGEYRDVTPVLTPDEARTAMETYQAIVSAVTGPDDYQTFKDSDGAQHQFRKRSGWKKLERFYGVSVGITDERIFHQHSPTTCLRVKMPETFKDVTDCGCPVKGVRYMIRATDIRSGRYSENLGFAFAGERRIPATASLHDIATRAFNRGANRATADLLGVSDPSAEEKQAEQTSGFSKEERVQLAGLFKGANSSNQGAAMAYLDDVGYDGPDERAIYMDFLKRGTEEHYERFKQVLSGAGETAFDPDDVPV
jgi:hypothetical protein